MARYNSPVSNAPNVKFGSNVKMDAGAWVDVHDDGYFECDAGLHLIGAKITVYEGASVKIGRSCSLRGLFFAYAGSSLSIGARTVCNAPAEMKAGEGSPIEIGEDCLIANATVYSSDFHSIYDVHSRKRINPARGVRIHDRVWLAQNSVVLKGAEIGQDTVVGAGAVVSGKWPGSAILAGSPARIIRRGIRWSREVRSEMPDWPCPPVTEEEMQMVSPRKRRLTFDNWLPSLMRGAWLILFCTVEDFAFEITWLFQ